MVFWVVILCKLVYRYQHFGAICNLHLKVEERHEDEGIRFLVY
jgi:hypothetical protein